MASDARDRSFDEEGETDEFWFIFDVEWPVNHPGLREAVSEAKQHGVRTAVSNPCFEIWLILHFQDQSSWLDNGDARRLRRKLDGSGDKGVNATAYMHIAKDAFRRARDLDRRHSLNATDFPQDNPSSGMHQLLKSIGFDET